MNNSSVQDPRHHFGALGEAATAQYLEHLGWEVIERNWRCARGELDLITRRGNTLAAVEVKSRRTHLFGHPSEAVTWRKLHRLRRLLSTWCAAHEGLRAGEVRIDVVAVTWPLELPLAALEHAIASGAIRDDLAPEGLLIEHLEGVMS